MEEKIYCDECNDEMTEGYTIYDGLYHYCSEDCLYKDICKIDYEKIHDMGYAFWTTYQD